MSILDTIDQAHLHREVYIALLQSVLHEPGAKRRLAARIGISPQYLSYLLQTETENTYSFRLPNARVAERIAQGLDLEPGQRACLLEHMHLARACSSDLARSGLSAPPAIYLKDIRAAEREANTTPDPHVFRRKYLDIRDTCLLLLQHSLIYTYPLDTVEICLLLHEALCILNQAAEALYYAKLAQAIMENLSRHDYLHRETERFDRSALQTIGAQARAYSDLRLYQMAYEQCLLAELQVSSMHYCPDIILSQLYRDTLQALCRTPRFALSEAEGLVDRMHRLCDGTQSELAPRWLFLAQQYLVRAYLNYASDLSLKKAGKLVTEISRQLPAIPHLGPLSQTLFFKTSARFYWQKGATAQWADLLTQALTTALDAGLAHQISDMKHTYGQALQPLLADLASRPTLEL